MLIASKNHQQEKHEILKRILFNYYETHINFDSKILYARLVDSLTVSHIVLLKLLNEELIKIQNLKQFEKIKAILLSNKNLTCKLPDNSFYILIYDLHNLGLIKISRDIEFKEIVRESGRLLINDGDINLPYLTITKMGYEFIEYLKL